MADKSKPKGSGVAEFYYPPNNLAKAIGTGSGPSLRAMEKEAARRLHASQGDYQTILQTTIQRMKGVLGSEETLEEQHRLLFVDAHDIKGQASLLGYPTVGEVAVCICVAIKDVPEKLQVQPDLLALHINALEWAFLNEHNDDRKAEKSALAQSLRDALYKE